MKINKCIFLFSLIFFLGAINNLSAQGRKREGRNMFSGRGFKKGLFTGNHSGGGGYGRRRIGTKEKHEHLKLYTRFRSSNKMKTDRILAKQNRYRALHRVRGNKTFSKKKY